MMTINPRRVGPRLAHHSRAQAEDEDETDDETFRSRGKAARRKGNLLGHRELLERQPPSPLVGILDVLGDEILDLIVGLLGRPQDLHALAWTCRRTARLVLSARGPLVRTFEELLRGPDPPPQAPAWLPVSTLRWISLLLAEHCTVRRSTLPSADRAVFSACSPKPGHFREVHHDEFRVRARAVSRVSEPRVRIAICSAS